MKQKPNLLAVVCLVVAFVWLWGVADVGAEVIKIGITDAGNEENYKALTDHLGRAGNDRFEIVFYPSVEELYRDFILRKLRMAFVGPVLYVEAHRDHGVVPLVKARPSASVIAVRDDSPITTLEGLRGRRLALGYPESTTSNLVPRLILWQNKIDRNDLVDDPGAFSRGGNTVYWEYLGTHSKVAEAVLDGSFDAGAMVDAVFDRYKNRGLRALHTSEPYPGVPVICHGDEGEAFKARMRSLFSSYSPPASTGYHLLKDGAQVASDSDYEVIRYLCTVVLGTRF